jgi:hypothetical protein
MDVLFSERVLNLGLNALSDIFSTSTMDLKPTIFNVHYDMVILHLNNVVMGRQKSVASVTAECMPLANSYSR